MPGPSFSASLGLAIPTIINHKVPEREQKKISRSIDVVGDWRKVEALLNTFCQKKSTRVTKGLEGEDREGRNLQRGNSILGRSIDIGQNKHACVN